MNTPSQNFARAQKLAKTYIKEGVSPDTALSEFSEALDDAQALPHIITALDSLESEPKGVDSATLKNRLHKRISDNSPV